MDTFAILLKVLQLSAAAAEAAKGARAIYEALREAAQQSRQLTPEQSAQLDQEAKAVFAAPESQPSGR